MKKQALRKGFLGLLGMVFSTVLWAHGGAKGTDTDQCKFELEKDHWIHYTAYEPKAYPAEEFCGNLPDLNTPIQLVFDYQDERYRKRAIEFEVTKEPEGTRVFYMPSEKHKSGTVVLNLPEGVADVSKYLIHITLLPENGGERLDAHMGFQAGKGQSTSRSGYGLYLLILLGGLYFVYLSNASFKSKVDALIGKAKEM
jgi:hypothetical protein